jgi:hypothetical protein
MPRNAAAVATTIGLLLPWSQRMGSDPAFVMQLA